MRTNFNITEILKNIINDNTYNNVDKKKLINFIKKEYLDTEELIHLISSINLNKKKIPEILYSILSAIDKKNSLNIIKDTESLIISASKAGFTWDNSDSCFEKVEEEFFELKEAVFNKNINNIKEELGDLIFSLLCYSKISNYDVTKIIKSANNKFKKRFESVKKISKLEKINLDKASNKTKEKLWKKAKKKVNSSQQFN